MTNKVRGWRATSRESVFLLLAGGIICVLVNNVVGSRLKTLSLSAWVEGCFIWVFHV